jgi:outer membrane protein assembly factor BamB
MWEYKTEGAVRSIAQATLTDGPAVLIGSEDEHVHAVSADGKTLLWKHRCYVSEQRYQAAPWWMMGCKAPVLKVFPYDLDGDGCVEIVCGTGGGFVECIAADGRLKWKTEFCWGLPNRFAVAPAAAGAKHLIVDAANSASGCWTWRLDAAGTVIAKNAFETGRGSWDATVVACSEIADMDGRGAWLAAVGRGGAFNELGLYDAVSGTKRWVKPMADKVTAVAAVDLDGDGAKEVLAGSVSAWLCAFDLDGRTRWGLQLPSQVLAVTGANGAVLAQCADGNVYRLSATGEFTGIHTPASPAPPADTDRWEFQRLGSTVLIGDRSGTITALRVDD